jgi:hypothetical protein
LVIDLGQRPTDRDGFNYIQVTVDVATRFCWLRPLKDKRAASTARRLIKLFLDFGFPRYLQSDNGREFANRVLDEILAMSNTHHRLVTAYNPRANGLAERNVALAKTLLNKLQFEDAEAPWNQLVRLAQWLLNTRVTTFHGSTPFTYMFARHANRLAPYDKDPPLEEMSPAQLQQRLQSMQRLLFPALQQVASRSQLTMKSAFDSTHAISEELPVGAVVMWKDMNRSSKSSPAWLGTGKVLAITKGRSYVIQDAEGRMLPRNLPRSQLRLVSDDDCAKEDIPTSIIDHRGPVGNREYLAKLQSNKEAWLKSSELPDADLIVKYWSRRYNEGYRPPPPAGLPPPTD